MTQDHPRVRARAVCPVCERHKDVGLVVCWDCYRRVNLRNGNTAVNALLDKCERILELDDIALESLPDLPTTEELRALRGVKP